jgi:hypothetical protein
MRQKELLSIIAIMLHSAKGHQTGSAPRNEPRLLWGSLPIRYAACVQAKAGRRLLPIKGLAAGKACIVWYFEGNGIRRTIDQESLFGSVEARIDLLLFQAQNARVPNRQTISSGQFTGNVSAFRENFLKFPSSADSS